MTERGHIRKRTSVIQRRLQQRCALELRHERRGSSHLLPLMLLAVWFVCAGTPARSQSINERDLSSKTSSEENSVRSDRKLESAGPTSVVKSKSSSTQSQADDQDDKTKPAGSSAKQPDDKSQSSAASADDRKGEWVIAPIPINSPAIGAGLEWVVGYVFPFNKEDKVSPPSMVGIGGLFTNNGSRATAIGGRVYLKEDKYRLTLAGGHASINADLYGVGKIDGDRGLFLPINFKGSGLFSENLIQIRKNVYVGFRFQYRDLRLALDRENSDLPPDAEVNPPPAVADIIEAIRENLLRQKTVSLGPRFQWDTRDNTLYPRRGFLLDSGIDFFAKPIGSEFTYQYYKAAFNKYASLDDHQVVAFRIMGCAAAGDRVPVYDLCLFGAQNDIRGYSAGRYQDRRMFATQAEYRFTLPKQGFLGRFGAVAFGGVGGVGNKFADIAVDEMLPAGGAGIRFRLTKKNPINFRIDYGIGKHGGTLIIGVGEAF